MYKNFIKRILDIILSFLALVILSPLLILTAFLIRIKLGTPVFFKQLRPGKNEKIFGILKFRTMTDAKDENGNLLPDEIRLTRFGQFLRSTSIDELPELLNILNGDMSIVGPRPLLVQYLERYNEEQKHRHDVKPGLTGLAQVNGRNGITWEEKFHYDLEYVKNITFYGDCKIIFQTVMKVFGREGISSTTSVTMEEFKGNK
ncbi:sugar transferase [Phascolarctobacterium faecium]|uniref:sugar transferase n=1 Tax=Phascolarctobacterium faecium TaxID=33025 RepID=UPI003A8CB293